jgi:hypothetical protein
MKNAAMNIGVQEGVFAFLVVVWFGCEVSLKRLLCESLGCQLEGLGEAIGS